MPDDGIELQLLNAQISDALHDIWLWNNFDPSTQERILLSGMSQRLHHLTVIFRRQVGGWPAVPEDGTWEDHVRDFLNLLDRAKVARGRMVGKHLEPLAERLSSVLGIEATPRVDASASDGKATSWKDIEIAFVSDHRVEIVVNKLRENANYAELGFADGRTGKPRAAWETLTELAHGEGGIEYPQFDRQRLTAIEKRMQEIRAILRKKFGLMTDPVPNTGTGYKAAFKIYIRQSFHS